MTRLAVALPVRNGQNYLAEAIESILAQEFGDFVLAISDNCSTDGTGDIIADYARRDKRVQSSRTESLLPIGANMSRSVTLAPAPWVKLFCHDDLMRGDCLAQIDAAISRWDDGKVALIGNGESHLLPSGARSSEVIGAEPYRMDGREAARQHMLGSRRYTMPAVTTATVRKASFEAIGQFDQRFEHFDHFCWLRIMAHHDVVFLPDTLTVTRVHEQQITNSSRISLGWMNDYRTFIREYLAENAAQIGLGPFGQLRARAIPVSVAAKSLAMELRTGQLGNFAQMLRGVPALWLPAMPPLLLRSWWVLRRHEQKLFASSDSRNEQ